MWFSAATSPAEFTVSPVYGSATTLNVSLVTSNIGTLNDDNKLPDNGSHHMQAPSPHSYILDSSYPSSAIEDTFGSQNGKERMPNRGKLRHAGLQDGYFSPKTAVKSIQAFAVQFKRPVDETWEETEREYEKSWMVVRNLIPG
ncbi:unnamed protein product [Dibothriocephalus latus]|uniref:Uncharacterized protein n=1 Tax=Dibothriocephalus latus TaxID=60516 RepID=A0A3P7NLN1_DIBLA|nr:unnamed protein product [Dibothriocephalus latus]